MSNFVFQVVQSQPDYAQILESVYRLRYQVYVEEWGFENPDDHPEGLEKDAFDQHSIHLYACSGFEDNIIGTARIILGSDRPFPIEQHFDISDFVINAPRSRIAEISRLAISKEFRRRAIDRFIFNKDSSYSEEQELYQSTIIPSIEGERRKCEHELIRGIYLLLYRESLQVGITHWYAVMARGLKIILGRWGIPFHQIGPEKEYHGLRAPYAVSIRDLEKNLEKKNPELLELARQGIAGG
jgi:N-acyl amino acid synthase of PEP-CTERM/exosortase system